jgi:thymidylate kinase
VFEGPDGVGKTTLVQGYAEVCRRSGERVAALAFPGNESGTLGHLVYQLHHAPTSVGVMSLTPLSLQVLHVAAHVDAIDRILRPLVADGQTVLLDRYWWSTWVYGVGEGVDRAALDGIIACEKARWGELSPEVVLLLVRNEPLRPEDAGPSWERKLRLYTELAAREAMTVPVRTISNNGSIEEALAAVRTSIQRIQQTSSHGGRATKAQSAANPKRASESP